MTNVQQPGIWRNEGEFRGGEKHTALISGITLARTPVVYSAVQGMAIFEGDIALGTVEQLDMLTGELRNQGAMDADIAEGVAISGTRFRWPDALVPFDIDPNLPNQQRIRDAIAHWEAKTPLRFPERTADNASQFPNYLHFIDGGGCWSHVGMQGTGAQSVSLGAGCSTGNAIHEIGHAIGLWHEQSREDRDLFVTINWANVQPGMSHNFDQHITDGDDIGTYDYGSIMHYPRTAFSVNGQDTITPVDRSATIGQRSGLSAGDIAAANALYPTVIAVPGWFGAEDQGADVAAADINGSGKPDLVVFHVDNPAGENHGYYRVGFDLNAEGAVTGGWSGVKAVPGWFGAEDQGAGIALTDVNGSGKRDLVVFHIDNPGGENHGYYRVGFDLNATGDVTGGWSGVKPVPGWFGAEDQGAGIALADLNGNGRPDLVVFHVDNPAGENHGYYRVGWNLNPAGDVTGGWSDIKAIPGWFGAENQGGGIAIADLTGKGNDLVVFHVDNPAGENRGYYRIGRGLDGLGNVTGGWGQVTVVAGWFGAEDQGAGVTLADLGGTGTYQLLVFHVDNPAGENHGYYRIVRNLR